MGILTKLRTQGIFVATAVIFAFFGILNPGFFTVDNLREIAVSSSVDALLGIGSVFVIITAGIDLSIGSVASLAGVVSATLMVQLGVPPVPSLVAGLMLGFVAGVINGLLITKLKLPPFIATLGTMSAYQGLAYVVTGGVPVYNVPKEFISILSGGIDGVPSPVIVVIVVGILSWFILRRTVFGQNIIATGGNEETAWLSGIRINRVKIIVYGTSGLLGALGGLIIVARISAAQTEAGSPYLLTAIAAAVIGGANLMGGEGRIGGTIVGALILGTLVDGLTMMNVPSFYELIVTGCVVLVAVTIDQSGKN